jgi:hypothetical protein
MNLENLTNKLAILISLSRWVEKRCIWNLFRLIAQRRLNLKELVIIEENLHNPPKRANKKEQQNISFSKATQHELREIISLSPTHSHVPSSPPHIKYVLFLLGRFQR